MLVSLLKSSEHAVGFGQIHMNVVLGRLSQIVRFIHGQQLFAVIDALAEVIGDQVHVAQILVSVLDKACMLLLYLQLDSFLVINILLLITWQLLLFHARNNGFSQTLVIMVLERGRILNVFFNVNRTLLLIEESLLCDVHRLDLLLHNDPVLDAVPDLILDLVLNT